MFSRIVSVKIIVASYYLYYLIILLLCYYLWVISKSKLKMYLNPMRKSDAGRIPTDNRYAYTYYIVCKSTIIGGFAGDKLTSGPLGMAISGIEKWHILCSWRHGIVVRMRTFPILRQTANSADNRSVVKPSAVAANNIDSAFHPSGVD